MRACLECDEEVDSDFCPDCGEETEEVVDCPECGRYQIEGQGDCIECGAEL